MLAGNILHRAVGLKTNYSRWPFFTWIIPKKLVFLWCCINQCVGGNCCCIASSFVLLPSPASISFLTLDLNATCQTDLLNCCERADVSTQLDATGLLDLSAATLHNVIGFLQEARARAAFCSGTQWRGRIPSRRNKLAATAPMRPTKSYLKPACRLFQCTRRRSTERLHGI